MRSRYKAGGRAGEPAAADTLHAQPPYLATAGADLSAALNAAQRLLLATALRKAVLNASEANKQITVLGLASTPGSHQREAISDALRIAEGVRTPTDFPTPHSEEETGYAQPVQHEAATGPGSPSGQGNFANVANASTRPADAVGTATDSRHRE